MEKISMAITVNLRYNGKNGSARRFAEENIRYEYYIPMNDTETVLLIDT